MNGSDWRDAAAEALFGRKWSDSMRDGVCVVCGGPAREFRDKKSVREHRISGMCQVCQDEMFREEE